MRRRMLMDDIIAVPNDEIWYYSPAQVTLYTSTGVVSHTFSGGRGVVKFNAPVTIVGNTLRGITTITDVKLPGSVTSIGTYAFYSCTSLALTSLPSGITSIGNYAFRNCTSLALTSLPSGVTSIGTWTFGSCESLALTSLPSGVTSIGNYAFSSCTSLALTSLPSGITSIGDYAFLKTLRISSLDIPIDTPPIMGTLVFRSTSYPIRVPAASVETYKAADGWSTYASRIIALP